MKYLVVLLLIVSALQCVAQEKEYNIVVTLSDKENKTPISNFKVEVVKAYFGNSTISISSRQDLGSTDDCGYLSKVVSGDMAFYTKHGVSSTDEFVLMFTHCTYGQFYAFFPKSTKFKNFELTKPYINDLKVITDDTKSFIKLQWKLNGSYAMFYTLEYPQAVMSVGSELWKVDDDGSGMYLIYNTSFAAGKEVSFTDYNVEKGKQYSYWVDGTGKYTPLAGCEMFADAVKIDLNDSTPDTTTLLPANKPFCSIILTNDTLKYGEVEVNSSVTTNITVTNIGRAPLKINALSLPEGFVTDFNGATINYKDSLLIPITFAPTHGIQYEGNIEINSDASGGSSQIPYSGLGKIITGVEISPEKMVQVYPNPYRDRLSIRVGQVSAEPYVVTIFSSLGVKLYSTEFAPSESNEYVLSLKSLPSGIHILHVQHGAVTTTKQIVKSE